MKNRVLIIDIETAPLLAHVWQAMADYVPYDQMVHDSFMLCWSAKWRGGPDMYGSHATAYEARRQNDKRLAKGLADMIREADIVIAHNIDRFDIPMLNNRLLAHGLEPLGPTRTLDTLKLAKQSFRLAYNKLDYLAKIMGLPRKIKTDFSWWVEAYHGEETALLDMFEYNQQDVVVLEQVFEKLIPYVKGLPRMFDADYEGQFACPFCGGEVLHKRGKYRTNASTFQKYQCMTCMRYSRVTTAERSLKLGVFPL